ncbi:MAG: transcription-repair coupling factor [Gammaproteobacteria bacterium 39-13]|nr:transcription-repair coupling factor [Gammaproteobacteria bacterium]OJV91864.1 MAG: transcription-repair coupling factor [Gammaproteobacteria bacterium 39-13]
MTSFANIFSPPLPNKPGIRFNWGNLQGAALPLAIAQAAKAEEALVVLLTTDTQNANRLERELRIFLPTENFPVLHFPDWETLPYDNFSPHQDIISDRLLALSQLSSLKKGILVVPITTMLHRISPRTYVQAHSLVLKVGDEFIWEGMRRRFEQGGYRYVSTVMAHGEFAIRGSIVDIFPMGQTSPVRIDLFDNEIDSLRLFDPETQRSEEKIESLTCLPAREFPLTDEAISLFRQNWRAHFSGDPSLCSIYQDISQGVASQGIEYYLPLFFEQTNTLFDYLPENSIIIRQDIEAASVHFWQEIQTRYEQYRHDVQRPILPPQNIFMPTDTLFGQLKEFRQIIVQSAPLEEHQGNINFNTASFPDLTIDSRSDAPLTKLQTFLSQTKGKILFCAESAGRRESLLELLSRGKIKPKIYKHWDEFCAQNENIGITTAALDEGMWLPTDEWIWIAENQLYGQQVMQRRRRQKATQDLDAPIRDLMELSLDAPVVHIDHGVGRYKGLTHITIDNTQAEYLILEYADNDKLYVPVSSLHLISQYSGAQVSNAPLHRLGTDQWEKAKKKAAEKAYDVAAELLDIYAHRAAKKGFRFSKLDSHYFQFASAFSFEETPDQAKAIEQVLADMRSEKTMDRLVCGDVGFGKTEVALRAAFVAVQDSKQVVLLVPTTLLAQQHFETFSDRFADWPIRIEVISRFRTKKEQEQVLASLSEGKIDIIIGTHKLLNESVKFKDLGLAIIDEEHRFGVRQKERLKSLRSEVDILTLTATPIPRTLNMAFSSLRDLSIIATPPAKRLSIKTFVREYNRTQVEEAVLRELMRGGQVYYLHNDVETIEKTANELAQLIPQARVGVAHGQMRERQLEHVMSEFYHQKFNVLVCTTIIETGIDVPSANTIIIDRADKLGLAQLHQLRGRVGRSHHQAYAYCLTPPRNRLTPDALKRLDAIESLEELGSGFTLATHDLEIRGAGELLGDEQSGNMNAVGFNLYMEMLQKAVQSLKSGKKITLAEHLRQGAEISLQLAALIPESYLPDVHSRLVLYKRIANAKNLHQLQELQVEMIDRFGLLPEPVKNLFKLTELKIKAEPIGIRKIEASTQSGKIEFDPNPNVDPDKVIAMIREKPHHFKLVGSQQIKFMFDMQTPELRFQVVENLINRLNNSSVA